MSKDNGGPAFPHTELTSIGEVFHDHLGASIRDYFAAKAMQGILSNPDRDYYNKDLAEGAYEIADAMIAARGES